MAPDAAARDTAASVALRSLTEQVLGLANEAHGLLSRAGRSELAVRLDGEARRWRAAPTMVVVAGGVKRGKSSLINALVERPGLLPVGAAVPTVAPLMLAWGAEPAVTVERWAEGSDGAESVEVELDALAEHVGGGVRRIEVRLPAPLLEDGLLLVDTPGIGSMSAGHRDLVLGLLRHADALVFVTSAEEPMLRSEAEFVATAAARVTEVAFVVSKVDLAAAPVELVPALKRRVEDLAGAVSAPQAAARLRELAGRQPLLTSSFLAERAARADDPDRAAALRQRSGIAGLHDALRRVVGDRTRIRLANVAQATVAVGSIALAELGATSPPDVARPAMSPGRRRQVLASGLSRIGAEGQRELSRALGDLEARYRDRVTEAKDLGALARDLPTELEQALLGAWLDVLASVDAKLRALVDELAAGPEAQAGLDESYRSLPERVRDAAAGRGLEPPKARPDPIDHGLPAVSASLLLGGALSIVVPGLGLVAYLIGSAAGSGGGAVRVLRQAKAKSRGQAAAAVAEAVRQARQELAGELQVTLIDRRTVLEAALESALAGLSSPSPGASAPSGGSAEVVASLTRIVREADTIRRRLTSG